MDWFVVFFIGKTFYENYLEINHLESLLWWLFERKLWNLTVVKVNYWKGFETVNFNVIVSCYLDHLTITDNFVSIQRVIFIAELLCRNIRFTHSNCKHCFFYPFWQISTPMVMSFWNVYKSCYSYVNNSPI